MRVVIAVAVVAALAGVIAWATRGSPAPKFTSGPPLLPAYQITYAVSNSASPGPATPSWEVLTVRRPVDGADLTYTHPPGPGSGPPSGNLATGSGLYSVDSAGTHLLSARQPGLVPGDQVLLEEMPDLIKRGLARRTSDSEAIAGRTCRVYQFFEPPVGPVKPLAGAGNHDDICLDSDGLLLSESWTYNGRTVMSRHALTVLTDGISLPTLPTGAASQAETATALPEPNPVTFIQSPTAPPGFAAAEPSRFHFADPQNPAGLLAASVVWSFTDGPKLVTVEAGQEADGTVPWQGDQTVTRTVHLAGLGHGETALRSDGGEVRIQVGSQGWVRVRGTLPLPSLVWFASRLRARP